MRLRKLLGNIYKVYIEIGRILGVITGLYFLFGLYSYFTGFIKNPWLLYSVLITSSLLLVIYIFFLIWKHFIANLKYPFYLKEAKYTHAMIDDVTWKSKKRFTLIPLIAGQFRYTDQYYWSGSGGVKIETATKNVNIKEVGKIEHRKYVDYCFNRLLGRGEEVTLDILYIAKDEEKIAQNYLEVKPLYPTKNLIMAVVLPENVCPSSARWIEKKNLYPEGRKIKQGKVSFDMGMDINCGRAAKVFSNPRIGYSYRLEWDFKR